MVKAGKLSPCEFINVESEFAAMSVSIGASAAGARAYTATASQGLLFMIEAVYNAAGLGLPIVMTLANRAIGAPINIWNDHSDAMAVRDSGWIQLFAETNQEAADLHVQAFRLAEELSLPVMVCMDGFILTHAVEGVDCPSSRTSTRSSRPYEPRQVLDPDDPISIGAMVGPEAFEEVRYLAHLRQLDALERIPALARSSPRPSGATSGGLLHTYRTEDAETIVVALGSVLGTIKDAADRRRDAGDRVGVVGITSFRPFPLEAVRRALVRSSQGRRRREGLQHRLRRRALDRRRHGDPRRRTSRFEPSSPVSADGRSPSAHSKRCSPTRASDRLEPLTFLDLDHRIVDARARPDGRDPALRVRRRRTSFATSGPSRPGSAEEESMTTQPVRFYQVGSFAVGNRLLDEAESDGPVRPAPARTRSTRATAPARDAARRSEPATPSTRRCGRRTAGSSP